MHKTGAAVHQMVQASAYLSLHDVNQFTSVALAVVLRPVMVAQNRFFLKGCDFAYLQICYHTVKTNDKNATGYCFDQEKFSVRRDTA